MGLDRPSMGTRQPRVLTKSLPWVGCVILAFGKWKRGLGVQGQPQLLGCSYSGSTSVQETLGSILSSATQMDDSENRSLCKNGVGQQGAQQAGSLPS